MLFLSASFISVMKICTDGLSPRMQALSFLSRVSILKNTFINSINFVQCMRFYLFPPDYHQFTYHSISIKRSTNSIRSLFNAHHLLEVAWCCQERMCLTVIKVLRFKTFKCHILKVSERFEEYLSNWNISLYI